MRRLPAFLGTSHRISLITCTTAVAAAALLVAAGCSKAAPPAASAAPAAKAEQPVTVQAARDAFWQMYTAAKQWAPDAVPMRLAQRDLAGYTANEGKAAMWEAIFASPSRRQYRVITYAIAAAPPQIYRGVQAAGAQDWSGPTRDAMSIDTTLFQTDSDAAYQAAATEASGWLKKHPDMKLTALELGSSSRFQVPVWYVRWGNDKEGYAAFVDASTGKVLKHK